MLVVIPARGGSKGIPEKNIKLFKGEPLISYSIAVARQLANDEEIIVSTDSEKIKNVVENDLNLKVPFLRPSELATDTSGTIEVLKHAVEFYQSNGGSSKFLVLLQPTSPFRTASQVREAIQLYTSNVEMVVSVKISDSNPYYNIFEENDEGFLEASKASQSIRRQDCPEVYEFNGAIYIIDIDSLKKIESLRDFKKIRKYVMDDFSSLDLDTPLQWEFAEFISNN